MPKPRMPLICLFLLMISAGVGRAGADPKAQPVLEQAFKQLLQSKSLRADAKVRYNDPKNKIAGMLSLSFAEKRPRFDARVSAHADFQGMQMDAQGEGKVSGRTVYFMLNQNPWAKWEGTGEWFSLDLGPVEIAKEKIVLPNLKGMPFFSKIKEKSPEKIHGVRSRHWITSVNPEKLFGYLLPKLPEAGKSVEKYKGFAPESVAIHLWTGASDNRLYQIQIPIERQGMLNVNFRYDTKGLGDRLKEPPDPIDARALGFNNPRLAGALFPPGEPAEEIQVDELSGKTITLVPFSPYGGPSPQSLKDFLKSRFHLQHVEISPEVPLPDHAFDSLRGEQVAEELLQTDANHHQNHFIIFLTDKEIYSKNSPQYAFVSIYGEANRAVISSSHLKSDWPAYQARTEKLLARTLGFLYWKLPVTTLHQDLMYKDVADVPEDFDQMGTSFLRDKSLMNLQEGTAREKEGRMDEAMALFEKAAAQNPLNKDIYRREADADASLGKIKESVEALNKALLLGPRSEDEDQIYFALGSGYEKLGEPVKAIPEYRAAAFLNPKRNDALLRLSDLFEHLGNSAKAREYLEKAK